jgi:DNA mismatch endonuclease, patch repair protein
MPKRLPKRLRSKPRGTNRSIMTEESRPGISLAMKVARSMGRARNGRSLPAKRARAVSPTIRKRVMSSIKSSNTKPELAVRRVLTRLGYRYRLHGRSLPGTPDILFPGRKLALFVHGCLWHLHENCPLARMPKSKPDYWPAKLARNKSRDTQNRKSLEDLGWRAAVIWECETRNPVQLERSVRQALARRRSAAE